MKFTFILCTKNSEKLIIEVINSIIIQRYDITLIDLIISDYQSTDNTLKIAAEVCKKNKLKLSIINCFKNGKSAALQLALNKTYSDYSVILDDDTILRKDFLKNAIKILSDGKIGCLGSCGIVDSSLNLPKWFKKFKGRYAIGISENAKDWVWGACAIINMVPWRKLKTIKYSLILNPSRENQIKPISIGGEDVELSLAIHILGYKVFFSKDLTFTHKFEQKRLTLNYLFENTFGVSRAIPILEIYRSVEQNTNLLTQKLFWVLKLLKISISCLIRIMISFLTNREIELHYYSKIIKGIFSGIIHFRKQISIYFININQIKNIKYQS